MTKTNAQRQAEFRARRQLTPRNDSQFVQAILTAYYAGRKSQRQGEDWDTAKILREMATDQERYAEEQDASQDEKDIAVVLRALHADRS